MLVAVAAVAGCGGDTAPAEQGIGVNRTLQLANCEDWNKSGVDERLITVKQLRDFAGAPVGNIDARGAILDDDQAYDLLEAQCDPEFAGAFKLYKLYVRAAAFTGH
jgi:hypothetical protein